MVLDWIGPIIVTIGYLGIFLLMLLESIILPLPSEVILPFAGFLAATGRLDFWMITIVATLGSLAGSSIAYSVGKHGGRPFLAKYGKYLLFDQERMEAAEGYFRRHGGRTVFYARLLPVVRYFISLSAGITRMPFRAFLLYTAAGAFIWNLAFTSVGFYLSDRWMRVTEYAAPIEMVLGVFIICGILWYILAAIEERTRMMRKIRQSETVQRPLRAAQRTLKHVEAEVKNRARRNRRGPAP